MKLLIVESPAKIKTIRKFLGTQYTIMSTMGHVKDLPQRRLGVDTTNGISLDYVTLENKEKLIADICSAAQKADEIYLAPDPDREGEIIAWHVAQEVKKCVKDESKIHRIAFNEITKPAIEKSLENPSTINVDKVHAQQARRVLDRWVGYEVSPILWKTITRGLSAGRVQSVALMVVCDREEEIRAFTPEEYWSVEGTFAYDGQKTLQASLTHINKKKAVISNKTAVEKIQKTLETVHPFIEQIKDSKRSKNPLAPFMTSTLQQAAYNRLNFSVQQAMQIAQKLYEGIPLEDQSTPVALITYMRTDSSRISDVAIKDVRSFIKSTYGTTYLPPKSRVYSKEKAQDAHEAIRPVDVTRTPDDVAPYLDARTLKLYRLIWNRFVACQMKPAEYAQRQVVINADPYTFKATGSTLLFDGFLKVYNTEEEEKSTSKIPSDIAEKLALELKKVDPKQHFTQPPARYTEASLVKKLEKEGIGRPSTYATILKRIQERAYTNLDKKKRFVPTELGFTVTRLLKKHLQKIMDVSFTANMEEDLDKVAQGDIERDKVLNDFYTDFSEMLKSFDSEIGKKQTEPTQIPCPECKDTNLVIRHGKAGAFLGCPNYPDCTYTANFERTEDGSITVLAKKSAEEIAQERKKNETTITCPACEDGVLVIRNGRSGAFLGCGKFPKCRYTANFRRTEENDEIELIENKKPAAKKDASAAKTTTKKKSTTKQAATKKSSTSKTTKTKQTKTVTKKAEENKEKKATTKKK